MGKIRLLDGRVIYGNFAPKPKPKLKELNNGFEVMARVKNGVHESIERCTVIEVNGSSVVVSYEIDVWDRPMTDPSKKPAKLTKHVRITQGAIICWASEWAWHAKVIQGNPYSGGKIVGLVDPAALDQLKLA